MLLQEHPPSIQVTLAGRCCRIPVGPPAPASEGTPRWVLHPHGQREHPAGLSGPTRRGNTLLGSPAPQFERPALRPRSRLPRLLLEWLQEPVRRLSLGKRPANGSQGPPDIPPSLPLKEKCPSELPSTLMHGAAGVLLKAKASKRLSSPLERPKGCPGVTPISAVGVGVYPKMLEGGGCDVPCGVPVLGLGVRGVQGVMGPRQILPGDGRARDAPGKEGFRGRLGAGRG